MSDIRIQNVLSRAGEKTAPGKAEAHDPISDFRQALKNSLNEVNGQLGQADQTTQEMLMGKQDIHQAMIAVEQANLSLRLMLQVRNKIISAYEEIMRMQI